MHNVPILGGMWGFANKLNRQLANRLFSIITNKKIASRYFHKGYSRKGLDQELLKDFFWRYAKKDSTIHDSYSCEKFGGEPFPTERPEPFCYVSCIYCCDSRYNINKSNHECPSKCRPKEHQDWIFC